MNLLEQLLTVACNHLVINNQDADPGCPDPGADAILIRHLRALVPPPDADADQRYRTSPRIADPVHVAAACAFSIITARILAHPAPYTTFYTAHPAVKLFVCAVYARTAFGPLEWPRMRAAPDYNAAQQVLVDLAIASPAHTDSIPARVLFAHFIAFDPTTLPRSVAYALYQLHLNLLFSDPYVLGRPAHPMPYDLLLDAACNRVAYAYPPSVLPPPISFQDARTPDQPVLVALADLADHIAQRFDHPTWPIPDPLSSPTLLVHFLISPPSSLPCDMATITADPNAVVAIPWPDVMRAARHHLISNDECIYLKLHVVLRARRITPSQRDELEALYADAGIPSPLAVPFIADLAPRSVFYRVDGSFVDNVDVFLPPPPFQFPVYD